MPQGWRSKKKKRIREKNEGIVVVRGGGGERERGGGRGRKRKKRSSQNVTDTTLQKWLGEGSADAPDHQTGRNLKAVLEFSLFLCIPLTPHI